MIYLPDLAGSNQLLTLALRRPLKLKKIPKPKPGDMLYAGLFADGAGKVVGALLGDLPLAAYAGAALSMIPADAASDCIKERELSEFIQDNYYEVLNVCSRLFSLDQTDRIRLDESSFPPVALPAEVTRLQESATVKRLDAEVEIEGYGKGRISLLLVD